MVQVKRYFQLIFATGLILIGTASASQREQKVEEISDIVAHLASQGLPFESGKKTSNPGPFGATIMYTAYFGKNSQAWIGCAISKDKQNCILFKQTPTLNYEEVARSSKWVNQIRELVEKFEKSKKST